MERWYTSTDGAPSAEHSSDSVRPAGCSGQAGSWAKRPALQRGCSIGRIDGHIYAYREQGGSEGCGPDAWESPTLTGEARRAQMAGTATQLRTGSARAAAGRGVRIRDGATRHDITVPSDAAVGESPAARARCTGATLGVGKNAGGLTARIRLGLARCSKRHLARFAVSRDPTADYGGTKPAAASRSLVVKIYARKLRASAQAAAFETSEHLVYVPTSGMESQKRFSCEMSKFVKLENGCESARRASSLLLPYMTAPANFG